MTGPGPHDDAVARLVGAVERIEDRLGRIEQRLTQVEQNGAALTGRVDELIDPLDRIATVVHLRAREAEQRAIADRTANAVQRAERAADDIEQACARAQARPEPSTRPLRQSPPADAVGDLPEREPVHAPAPPVRRTRRRWCRAVVCAGLAVLVLVAAGYAVWGGDAGPVGDEANLVMPPVVGSAPPPRPDPGPWRGVSRSPAATRSAAPDATLQGGGVNAGLMADRGGSSGGRAAQASPGTADADPEAAAPQASPSASCDRRLLALRRTEVCRAQP
jgi:hypothetical protein